MKTLCALLALLVPQDLPPAAQEIVTKADAKLEALRKSYEEACAKVKAQEVKDLQRVHDAVKKGDAAGAGAIKAKIDALSADVLVVGKGAPAVVQWLQGKWIMAGVADKNFGEVWEFKGEKVIGTGVGDRVAGKILIDGGKIQVVWDSGLVEFVRVPETFGDEATGVCRTGEMKAKRMRQ
jgi:hypothetical protein